MTRTMLALALAAGCAVADTSADGIKAIAAACGGHRPPYDVTSIVATGQSLSIGVIAKGSGSSTLSLSQPYGNLMLHDCGPAPQYPRNGVDARYSLIPLVEPMRPAVLPGILGYEYPTNILPGSEPPTTHMANEISRLWADRGLGDYTVVVTNVGVNAAPLASISKGSDIWSFDAALGEVRAIRAIAAAEGKTFGVSAVVLTHGEANQRDPNYRAGVVKLYDDYNASLKQITGQQVDVVMIASQESSLPGGLDGSPIGLWLASKDRPGKIVVSGPKYQYDYSDEKHLTARSYEWLGASYAKVFDAVINRGEAWHPLEPIGTTRTGATIRVTFNVPVPPLAWDPSIPEPWPSPTLPTHFGRGFEVHDAITGAQLFISSVAIEGDDSVRIDLKTAPTGSVVVSYATSGTRGQLRDSDATTTPEGFNLHNYCVSFSLPIL